MSPYADINGDFHCPECGALLVDFDESDPLCRGCCKSCGWEETDDEPAFPYADTYGGHF